MRICGLTTVLLLCSLFAATSAFSFEGPLQTKDQFPLFIYLDEPYPEQASIEDSLSVNFSYSSVYMVKDSAEWSVNLDMEVAELDFRYRKTLFDRLELGMDLPVLSFYSGFMDNFLSWYHGTFGFGDYGRSERPANSFLYEIRRNGNLVVSGENGRAGLGDIRLTAKTVILKRNPSVSLKADVELPTGDASSGFGNGSTDAGVALLLDQQLGNLFKVYLNLGAVFPGDLKADETVRLRNYYYGALALEAAVWENTGIIGQIYLQNSPYPEMGISTVDRTAALLTIGGRYHPGQDSFEFSFTEDPNTAGAPDFSVNLVYKRSF